MRRPRRRRRSPLAAALFLGAFAISCVLGLTAANVVPASRADDLAQILNVNELKPAACNGIVVTVVVFGGGTAQADLVLGTAGPNNMSGLMLSDCVLGGGGADTLAGGGGVDVCIGGPGFDTFNANCETQIQ